MEHTDPYGDVFPIYKVLCGWEVYYCFDDIGAEGSGVSGGMGDSGGVEGGE